MFVKVTSSGSRRYLQLVEAYRDDLGKPKQRTVATLGRLDLLDDQLDQVMEGKIEPILDAVNQHFQTEKLKQESAA